MHGKLNTIEETMNNTQWKRSLNQTPKYVGNGNKLLSIVRNAPAPIPTAIKISSVSCHIKVFDRKSFEYVDEIELVDISERYIRLLFELGISDPILESYQITKRQKKHMERLAEVSLNIDLYDYFMESN